MGYYHSRCNSQKMKISQCRVTGEEIAAWPQGSSTNTIHLYSWGVPQHFHNILLDISRQLACMKLGSREIYQPIQYCWIHTCRLLGYLVHTCNLPIDIQQVSSRTPDRTAFACNAHAALSGVLQLIFTSHCL